MSAICQKIRRCFIVALAGACVALTLVWPSWQADLKAEGDYIVQVPIDIQPESCPNVIRSKEPGVFRVAIIGTENFDVTQVDIASVRLAWLPPVRSRLKDVATPFEPYLGKESYDECNIWGPDGYLDLELDFETDALAQAVKDVLGNDVESGDLVIIPLRAYLSDNSKIIGEDVFIIE